MISLNDLALQRGRKLLFEGVSLTLHPGWKVGVVGRNGTGKSSLFQLLRGELHPDQGSVGLPEETRIASVAQETPALARSALDYAIDGDTRLREVEAALATAEAAHDGARIAHLHAELEALDGYTVRARAGRLLHGLGFGDADLERPVSAFSGGWRVRLNLAQALMCPSDLLLLDEPTNHLDLDAVLWLEQWLRAYPGTLLLISHDRDFLDNVVDRVANVENNTITLFRGGYSEFERQRAERLAQQQALHERQQREVAHMRAFVDRFRAKATKARQAQSRLKALERMEIIEAAHVDSPFRFAFRKPERLPNPLLVLDRAAAGYGGHPVIDNVRLTLLPGQRLGLLGHNGAGKSTLIKLLAGEISTLAGERTGSDGLKIGYFAQHQLEQLDPEASALLHLQRLDGRATEQELRNFLGGFAFQSDRVLEPCGHFSGGEKARLVLALLVWQSPNLLLLDEPTNHLDLEMRDALNRALQDYTGAVVLVSHDRHLLRTTTDALYLVADGAVRPFDGDLDDYRDWLAREADGAPETSDAPAGEHTATARKAQRRAAAEQRARLQPLTRELQKLELEMERRQAEQAQIEAALADPALYDAGRKEELKQWLQRQAETATRLEQAEHRWLETSERIEALRAELEGS